MSSNQGYKLTQRDLKVIELVEDYHLLTTSQIQKLLYPSMQKAQTRLYRIWKSGLVKRFPYPVLLREGGRGEYIYHINRKPKMSMTGVLHTIELNDIRIAFDVACRESEHIEMIEFIPEYKGIVGSDGMMRRIVEDRVRIQGGQKTEQRFIPDAAICLEKRATRKRILLFIELDLGSEKLVTRRAGSYSVVRKLEVYKEYLKQEGYKKHRDKFDHEFMGFRVLVIMSNQQRTERLRKELTLKGIKKFVWFTQKSEITTETILKEIWTMSDVNDEKKYSIIRGKEQK